MKNMCSNCDKRDKCIELCEEAEKYAGQDYVGQSEYISNGILPEIIEENSIWSYTKDKYTTDGLKYMIIKLYEEGMDSREIAYHLPCSFQYAHKIIKKYKNGKVDKYGKEISCI